MRRRRGLCAAVRAHDSPEPFVARERRRSAEVAACDMVTNATGDTCNLDTRSRVTTWIFRGSSFVEVVTNSQTALPLRDPVHETRPGAELPFGLAVRAEVARMELQAREPDHGRPGTRTSTSGETARRRREAPRTSRWKRVGGARRSGSPASLRTSSADDATTSTSRVRTGARSRTAGVAGSHSNRLGSPGERALPEPASPGNTRVDIGRHAESCRRTRGRGRARATRNPGPPHRPR